MHGFYRPVSMHKVLYLAKIMLTEPALVSLTLEDLYFR